MLFVFSTCLDRVLNFPYSNGHIVRVDALINQDGRSFALQGPGYKDIKLACTFKDNACVFRGYISARFFLIPRFFLVLGSFLAFGLFLVSGLFLVFGRFLVFVSASLLVLGCFLVSGSLLDLDRLLGSNSFLVSGSFPISGQCFDPVIGLSTITGGFCFFRLIRQFRAIRVQF